MLFGRLAQLVEHPLDVREVTGSSPVSSTKGTAYAVPFLFSGKTAVCGISSEILSDIYCQLFFQIDKPLGDVL